LEVSFASQPFLDDRGSALHVNLSLLDKSNNRNVFNKDGDKESELLLFSIGGVLQLINQALIFSMPEVQDYIRYDKELDSKIFPPINVSWGYNNRTTVVRVPLNDKLGKGRRLELRTPVSDADIYLVISSLLIMAQYGIENKIEPIKPTYGNAFDKQYDNLKGLVSSYDKAKTEFLDNSVILEKISNSFETLSKTKSHSHPN
jgi:glutamine synthetase